MHGLLELSAHSRRFCRDLRPNRHLAASEIFWIRRWMCQQLISLTIVLGSLVFAPLLQVAEIIQTFITSIEIPLLA